MQLECVQVHFSTGEQPAVNKAHKILKPPAPTSKFRYSPITDLVLATRISHFSYGSVSLMNSRYHRAHNQAITEVSNSKKKKKIYRQDSWRDVRNMAILNMVHSK
jgi:hypothetical protein